MVTHSRPERATARSRVGIVLEDGSGGRYRLVSPAGPTPLLKKQRDGSMYSQAYVRAPQVAPKLDNAGRLRGLYFIDPADAEFKETVKNARRKLEVPMPAAMPCKIREESIRKFVAILIRMHR